jgi:hypothetical protein
MAKVVGMMSMSLDGYVADANDGLTEVFDWYFSSGDIEVSTASATAGRTYHVSAPSADYLRGMMAEVGAVLIGRHTFEIADGWAATTRWGRLSSSPITCPMAGHGPARQSSSSPTASKAPLLERNWRQARSP